ncbi:MAG: hypothetical protein JSW00_13565 [Thermoplasmata archaeon]|nr:MAG: hypothetical protein JSW00_13565 [Thermoplasmata archaeon]
MTVYKRGSMYLICLVCGNRDFDIVKHFSVGDKVLRCKNCGFMIKESGYFNIISGNTLESPDEQPLPAVKK